MGDYSKKNDDKKRTKSSKILANYKREPIFIFPPLPNWETAYYFFFLFAGIVWFFPPVYTYSQLYKWETGYGTYEYNVLPYFGERQKDITDFEWRMWSPHIQQVVPWMMGHFLLFNILEKILPQCIWSALMLIYWLVASGFLFSLPLVVVALTFGTVLYTVMITMRNKYLIWFISVWFIYFSMNFAFTHLNASINEYMTMAFLSYKMLKYISYCMEEIEENKEKKRHFLLGLYNMFWYAFYLPYSISLAVLYRDFLGQLKQRHQRPRNWLGTLCFTLRILFWYAFIEFALHFLYFGAICTDPEFLRKVPLNVLLVMGYAAAQFFHTKYVVIFGAPAAFARLDNMEPPQGPVCIARVPLFARIWRQFDRGLYQFFKTYIFLPICQPTFSVWRKLFAVLLCYGFVLFWHGFEHQYIVWIVMNIIELFLETSAKVLYLVPSVRRWRETHISDRWFRRFIAFLCTCPWAIGCYANFYFVTDSEVGYVFVDRLFWGETVTFNWPFPFLVFGGYHLVNVCIDIDRWLEAKQSNKVTKKIS